MRRSIVLLVVLAALAGVPAVAYADGDPASDVLLLQDSYLPYQPPVSKGIQTALNKVLQQTKAKGYNLKVAVISSTQDLGTVPQLFNKATQYAPFLEREIAFNSTKPLLVVMPNGYGLASQPAAAQRAIGSVGKPSSSNPDDLARSAIDASVALAKATGHPVVKRNVPGGGGSSSTSPALIFGVPVVLLALAGLLVSLKRRDAERDAAAPT